MRGIGGFRIRRGKEIGERARRMNRNLHLVGVWGSGAPLQSARDLG